MTDLEDRIQRTPHAIERAKERYGLNLTVEHLEKITHIIQNNGGTFDKQHADGKTQWYVTYKNTPVRVLISKDFYRVITFLPLTDGMSRKSKRRRKKCYKHGEVFYQEMEA